MSSDPLKKARGIAFRLLAKRARTVEQIRSSLNKRDIPAAVSEQVMAELLEAGYLNDLCYVQNFLEYQLANNFHGPQWLRSSLLRAGIKSDLIEDILPSYFPPGREEKLAAAYLNKIMGRSDMTPQKAMRRLLGRGFNMQAARRAVTNANSG